MSSQKIIDGLQQAVAGEFGAITIDGVRFAIGDRVAHQSGMTGAVSRLSRDGVHVAWDNSRSVGIYDERWFRGHPGWLQHVSGACGQSQQPKQEG